MIGIQTKFIESEKDPRSKLVNLGSEFLSNVELIALVLGSGSNGDSVLNIAKRLMEESSHQLKNLSSASIEDFESIKGIGKAKASLLYAVFELNRRKEYEEVKNNKIDGSKSVAAHMSSLLKDLNHEEFWVLFLNRSNYIIKKECISKGGISGTVVDSKIILKKALQLLASSIILIHNHPSGNRNPSAQDDNVTKKMKSACKLLEINLLDHLIISGNAYYSYADESRI